MIDLGGRSPDFQRLMTAIRHRDPDTVPFVELVIEQEVKAAYLGRPIESLRDEIAFWASAGYDYIPLSFSVIRPGRAIGGIKSDSFSVYDVAQTERTWAEMHSGAITTRDEFTDYPWPEADSVDVSVLDEIASQLPDGMRVIAVVGKVFTGSWMLMGMEHFFLSTLEDPELVEMICERVGSLQMSTFERVVDHPVVGAIWNPDDLAGTQGPLVSPELLRRCVFPWYRRMGETCRRLGKPMIFHSDGNVIPLLEDIIGCGFEALHPIEGKAMDIVALKRSHGDRLALFGNIDLDFPLSRGTPEDVDREVRERITALAPGGGYALSAGNSIPEYIPLANFEAMLSAGLRYGRYPMAGQHAETSQEVSA